MGYHLYSLNTDWFTVDSVKMVMKILVFPRLQGLAASPQHIAARQDNSSINFNLFGVPFKEMKDNDLPIVNHFMTSP